ncbi:MAG: glycosyltransferase involved in cell wall biosynthesis [Gammaproteobacteria bacterium]|jgi:glycosyltransferase involved in cell wall biosynthesis
MQGQQPLAVIPVILTLDEAPNIARVLSRLHWAKEVLVVDSGSLDGTRDIARSFDNVRVIEHPFENFESQWNFAIEQARARSPWILALDADYVLGDEFIDAVTALRDPPPADAFRASFRYCVLGRLLRGSLYPAKVVLFHADKAKYVQRGHTQVLQVNGREASLAGEILHDDRKSQSRWLRSQVRYAREEAAMIDDAPWQQLPWSARLRRLLIVAAPAAFVLSMFWRGGILDGWPGLFYAMQRCIAELLIAMALIERRIAVVRTRDPR